MRNKFDITHPLAILLAFTTMALALPLPTWLTINLALWLFWSLIALLVMADPNRRDFVEGTLRHSRFTQIYAVPTKRIVDWFWSRYCDKAYQGNNIIQTFRHALTWRLYDKALLIAVAYPFWLLIIIWIIWGDDSKLGDVTIIPAANFWPERAATLGTIAILLAGVVARKLAAASRHRVVRQAADWLLFLAVVFAGAGAGAVAVAFAVAAAVAVAFAGAFAGAIAFAGAVAGAAAGAGAGAAAGAVAVAGAVAGAGAFAGAVAVAVAVAVAFAVAGAVDWLNTRGKPQLAHWLVTTILPIGWIALLILLPWADISQQRRGIFLFLGVLPLINALFDVVSYAVTLTLLRLGLRARLPILNGLADLAIAMVLFLALGACLIILITAMNALAQTPVFDLDTLFNGIRAEPSDYYWLYLMMFSTLLPTAAHGAITLLGLQGITPRPIRRRIADLVKSSPNRTLEFTLAPLAVGAIWAVPFLIVGWGVIWVWPYLVGWVTNIGWFYLDTLAALAQILST